MDGVWQYVWPNELSLQIIIGVIWLFALCVLFSCVKIRSKAKANLKMLEELKDVSFLENVLKMNGVDVAQCFENYKMATINKMKNEKRYVDSNAVTPLFDHLKAIYDAGHKSSRLDSDLLVKNTVNKIFGGVDTVRTAISLFLVIGILGTLVGLAISIGSFSGEGFVVNSQANNTAAELSNLFSNLRGAFAPSMWGVFCTILFVVSFSIFIQEACINRLTEKLTNNTINVWLPVLYPTDFQKSENSLVKLNETVKNAENINTGAQGLLQNLAESNATVIALKEAAGAVTETQNAFNDGAAKFTEMKEALAAMQQQIREQNDGFLVYMGNLASQNKAVADKNLEITNAVKENYLAQSEKLEAVIHTLKMYDENFTEYRKNSEESLVKSIETNNEIAKKISDSEEHLVKAIGEPLRQQLATDLQIIGDNIGMAAMSLKQINNPLVESNKKMQQMFEGFGRSFDELLDNLAAKAGLTPKEREQIISVGNNAAIGNARIEEKLEAILQVLSQKEEAQSQILNVPDTVPMGNARIEEKLEAILQVLSQKEEAQPQILNVPDTVPMGNAKVEEKLSAILQALREQRTAIVQAMGDMRVDSVSSTAEFKRKEKSGIEKMVQVFIPIVLAVLLAISIGVQVMMANRLTNLEKAQNSVTETQKILLTDIKKELENKSEDSQTKPAVKTTQQTAVSQTAQ